MNFHAVGRLAEYRYYDMDGVTASALEQATVATIESGKMTGDLALITSIEHPTKLSTGAFIKAVADRVHEEGGTLFMQIMHGGRTSHPDLIDGANPEAPSAFDWGGTVRGFAGKMDAPVPRELKKEELPRMRWER